MENAVAMGITVMAILINIIIILLLKNMYYTI